MQNKISDLANHLFAQLERLGDENLKGHELSEEISRASAISDVAQTLVNCAKTAVDYHKVQGSTKPLSFFEDVKQLN